MPKDRAIISLTLTTGRDQNEALGSGISSAFGWQVPACFSTSSCACCAYVRHGLSLIESKSGISDELFGSDLPVLMRGSEVLRESTCPTMSVKPAQSISYLTENGRASEKIRQP